MNDSNGNERTLDRSAPAQARTVYSTPTFRVLGTLADLTATGSKNGKENKGNRAGNKP